METVQDQRLIIIASCAFCSYIIFLAGPVSVVVPLFCSQVSSTLMHISTKTLAQVALSIIFSSTTLAATVERRATTCNGHTEVC